MTRSARSTRFPLAVHIMGMVSFIEKHMEEEYVSSALIAKSTAKNQVVVLRMVAMLKEAGLVESTPGSRGGVKLARHPSEITLFDIYSAVESQDTFSLHEANERCPAARVTAMTLSQIFEDTEAALEARLSAVTVEHLCAAAEADPIFAALGPEGLREKMGY